MSLGGPKGSSESVSEKPSGLMLAGRSASALMSFWAKLANELCQGMNVSHFGVKTPFKERRTVFMVVGAHSLPISIQR